MAIRLRLSTGHSFAVAFDATNEQTFRRKLRHAALEFFADEGKDRAAELHVADYFGAEET